MRASLNLLPILIVAAMPASAQQRAPSAYDRAIAAGYKALTLCSAIFVASRTQAQVEALELTGIYPEYDALLPSLEARVDRSRQSVSVPFANGMPPRFATYSYRGCTIHPIGSIEDPDRPDRILFTVTHGDPNAAPWPNGDERATARSGRDEAGLRRAIGAAMDGTYYGAGSRTTAVVVVQGGEIVSEDYAAGFSMYSAQRTWSVAKSLSGTIIGIAVGRGLLAVDRPAPVPEWQGPGDPRARITLDHLLRMASGLHSDHAGNRTDAIYFGGTAVTEQAVAWPLEAPPGSRFRYANNDTLIAIRALRAAMPGDEPFASTMLFSRIGMRNTVAETDWQGNYILSSQVWSTARDLARVGLLWLNDGVWNGERLLPEGWMSYMTRPSGPQPAQGPGYGATMWLYGPAQGLPEGSYAARGNRGQFVMVVSSRSLVIVRRGEDPAGSPFDIARFTADVLTALQ